MQQWDKETTNRPSIAGENKVRPIPLGHFNIYLIETEGGYILVDAGMPNMGGKLDQAFAQAGVDPQRVGLIIATHGHLDHVGSIAYAHRVTGAQVLCHRSISENLANGETEPAVPQNLMGRLLNLMTSLAGSKFEGIQPDIVMEDEFDLGEYGISGKVIHTPGHSPGSISIVLDNGEALVGDLVREEGSGKIGPGMFYEDRKAVLESLEKVAGFEPSKVYLSHGDYIDGHTLRKAVEAIKQAESE